MVSIFYSDSMFYSKSIIQNVYFIYSLTKDLASAENFAYTVDVLSLRVRGAEVKKTEGKHVTRCFLCREKVLKRQQSIT